MQGRLLGISESLSAAWATFLRYPGVLIGIFLVYTIVVAGLGSIPFIGSVIVIFIAPPLIGGALIAGLKAVRGQTPEFNDLLVGFSRYWHWMGVYWLFAAILFATMLPVIIGAAIAGVTGAMRQGASMPNAAPDISPAGVGILVVTGLISLVLYVIFGLKYMFALYEAADGAEIIDSFKNSDELARNVRFSLLGTVIVLGLFAAVGVIACGVGVILTSLLSYLAFIHIYVGLKGEQSQTAMPQPPESR